MKYIFTMLGWLCMYAVSHAQVLTLLDATTGQAVESAVISNASDAAIAITNADGQADIASQAGAESIYIKALGYVTQTVAASELTRMNYTIRLTPETFSLDQVVISASKWNQGRRETPYKITTLSPKSIALQNPQTAADMLGQSGEVFIQKSQQGGGSPMIRGFATNRLLYVVDGVRMNSAIFRAGNIQNVISLDPFSMENVEILFGPGSVMYGSDAIGGVMNFTTLRPQLSYSGSPLIKGSATARTSSANQEMTGHFDVSVGGRKWALVSSISSNDFGDLRMGSHGPDEYLRPFYVQRQDSADVVVTNDDPLVQRPSGYAQINLMQKFRFAPNDKWDFQYGLQYSATSSYARYDRHIRYRQGLPRYGEWEYGPQKWTMHHLQIDHHGRNKVYDELTLHAAYQRFEESRIDRNIQDAERHIRIEEVDAYSINVDFLKRIRTRHQLSYGLEAVIDDVTSIGIDEDISTGDQADGPARYPQATWSSYAVYANYLYKVSDKTSVNGGARYNTYAIDAIFDTRFYPFPYTTAELNNGSLTGTLGVAFTPSATFSGHINFSTGFRSPNVDDMGKVFDSEPGAVIVPNPDLEAEYAYNAELGFAKLIGSHVRLDVTGYYTILQNAMVRRDFTLNGQDSIEYDGELSRVQAIQNAAKANVYGVQAGLDIKLPGGFGFATHANYQVGEEELDDGTISPSRHAAPFFGMTSVSYRHQKAELMLYSQYSAEKSFDDLPQEEQAKTEIYAQDENGDPYSPAWMALHFKGSFHLDDRWTISGGLENITDKRYRPYSSGIVAPGRNFILSARVKL